MNPAYEFKMRCYIESHMCLIFQSHRCFHVTGGDTQERQAKPVLGEIVGGLSDNDACTLNELKCELDNHIAQCSLCRITIGGEHETR